MLGIYELNTNCIVMDIIKNFENCFVFESCFKGNEKDNREKHKETFKECLSSIENRGERFCHICLAMGREYESVGNAVYWTLSTFSSNNHPMDVARAFVLCLEHVDKSFNLVENGMVMGSVEILDKIYEGGCKLPCMIDF